VLVVRADAGEALEKLQEAAIGAPGMLRVAVSARGDGSKALVQALNQGHLDHWVPEPLSGGELLAALQTALLRHSTDTSRRELVEMLRQENAAATFALAKLRAADLTLAIGEGDAAVVVAEDLVNGPRPTLPQGSHAIWNEWLEEFAAHVEQHLDPGLTTPLAPRLREWGRLP